MLVAHVSDLHGKYKKLGNVATPDLWIISGDFFPNYGRGPKTGGMISEGMEITFQDKWWGFKAESIIERLREKPVVWVPGNHDFISLAGRLKFSNYPAPVFDLTKGPAEFGGKKFAGYREIPYICGEWPGEIHDFSSVVAEAMDSDPDILVTHAPPGGILDQEKSGESCGVPVQTVALTYRPHRITHHFFGHVHHCGGKVQEEMGITFVNSATQIQLVEV